MSRKICLPNISEHGWENMVWDKAPSILRETVKSERLLFMTTVAVKLESSPRRLLLNSCSGHHHRTLACTYIPNGVSKKPRGTHTERPTFLSLNSGIDSPCKGLKMASAAPQNDQGCMVPDSYAGLSRGVFSTHHFGLTQREYE